MAKVLCLQQSAANTMAASTTRFIFLACNSRADGDGTTESVRQITYRSAGKFSNLYINILTNDRDASTFRTRVNVGNAAMVVSITGSTTGKFEDNVNTDTVTAAEEWNYSLITGANGTVFTWRTTSVLFSATTNTVGKTGGDATTINTASTTIVGPLCGDTIDDVETVDATVGVIYRVGGTLSNFFVNIPTNARTTTTTIGSRIDSANGNLVVSVTSGATGFFEDTSNSDTIVSGSLVNGRCTTGTGTENIGLRGISADFTTTSNKMMYTAAAGRGATVLISVTTYYLFAGALRTDTTESNMIAESNLNFTGSLMQCNITANTITAASTLTFRINSGAGAAQTVSITASTTGVFQDTVNTDVVVATDTIDYLLVTGGTGTSLVIRSISMLGDSSLSRNINTFERKTFRGVLRGVGRGSI